MGLFINQIGWNLLPLLKGQLMLDGASEWSIPPLYSNSNWQPLIGNPLLQASARHSFACRLQKSHCCRIIVFFVRLLHIMRRRCRCCRWIIIWSVSRFQYLENSVGRCIVSLCDERAECEAASLAANNATQLSYRIAGGSYTRKLLLLPVLYVVKTLTMNIPYLLGEGLNGRSMSWHIAAVWLSCSVVWDSPCVSVSVIPSRQYAS